MTSLNKNNFVIFSLAVIIIIATAAVFVSNINSNPFKHVFAVNSFSGLKFTHEWKSIKNTLSMTDNSRLEGFYMTIGGDGEIQKIQFDIIDKKENNRYEIFQFYRLFSVNKQSELLTNQFNTDKWIQYQDLITAGRLFELLDDLGRGGWLNSSHLLVYSSGLKEAMRIEGEYYRYHEHEIIKLSEADANTNSQRFHLVVHDKQNKTNKIITIDL